MLRKKGQNYKNVIFKTANAFFNNTLLRVVDKQQPVSIQFLKTPIRGAGGVFADCPPEWQSDVARLSSGRALAKLYKKLM